MGRVLTLRSGAAACVIGAAGAAWGQPTDLNANGVADGLEFSGTPDLASSGVDQFDEQTLLASVTSWTATADGGRVPFDANGDGLVDLAVLHHVQPAGLSLYVNDGSDGLVFDSYVSFSGAGHTVHGADVDGDGDHDLVVNTDGFNEEWVILVLENDGSGAYSIAGGIDEHLGGMDLADLDGDGAIDLAGDLGDDVGVFLNDGSGGFSMSGSYPGAGGFSYDGLATGDVDQDGDVDVIVADQSGVRVHLNAGGGTFPFSGYFAVNEENAIDSVAFVDVTGDGISDVVTATDDAQDGGLHVLDGFGDGTFDAARGLGVTRTRWLEHADLDDDGDVDLMAAGGPGSGQWLRIVRNAGGGEFAGVKEFDLELIDVFPNHAPADLDQDGVTDVVLFDYDAGSGAYEVLRFDNELTPPTAEDCNGNGIPDECDLVAGAELGGSSAFETSVEPVWSLTSAMTASNERVPLVLDDNGLPDLVTANENDESVSVLLNAGFDGGDWLGLGDHEEVESVFQPVSLACADFDQDGDFDVAVGDVCNEPAGEVRVHLNDSAGGFPDEVKIMDAGTWIAAAELTGDGAVDIVSSFALLRNKADGTGEFFDPEPLDSGGDDPAGVATADVDQDGDHDVIIANTDDGTVGVLLNDGAGVFDEAVVYEVGSPHGVCAADLDGDEFPDLAVANNESGGFGTPGLAVLMNDGDGTFGAAVTYEVSVDLLFEQSLPVRFVAGEDVDLDGDVDLVLPIRGGDEVAIMLNTGDGTFLPLLRRAAGAQPGRVSVADLDLDGAPSLWAPVQFADEVVRLPVLGATDPASGDADGDGVPDECQGCYADFNGDGALSILDFVAFQRAFVAGDPVADCNGDGVLSVLDFVCFQEGFVGGCEG